MAKSFLKDIASSFSAQQLWMIAAAVAGLALVFIFQGVDFLDVICPTCEFHANTHFASKKVVRVLLNDSFMLLLIHALFRDPAVTRLAWYIQLVDTLVLLPLYLFVKLYFEGDTELSSPLLSQLHRLIVNPTLMVLLIPAVYYQRSRVKAG